MNIVKAVNNFVYFWENEQISPIDRRYIKSCMSMKFQMGPFFHVEPSTLFNTFIEVVDMTMTMLLA